MNGYRWFVIWTLSLWYIAGLAIICSAEVYDVNMVLKLNNITRGNTINNNLSKWTTNYLMTTDKYEYNVWTTSCEIKLDGRIQTTSKRLDLLKGVAVATTAWNSNFLTGSGIWIHNCTHDAPAGQCAPCVPAKLWGK